MKFNEPKPSDKELQDLWNDMYWEPGAQSTPMVYRYARAVLERWGKPELETKPEYQPLSDW